MLIANLKKMEDAPQKGTVLAYFQSKIMMEPYADRLALKNALMEEERSGEELLEMHLFDETKENRCIRSESRRFPDGVIEYVSDFSHQDMDNVFAETVLLENGDGKMTVWNHIRYDEQNGMASLDDYRLSMEKEG